MAYLKTDVHSKIYVWALSIILLIIVDGGVGVSCPHGCMCRKQTAVCSHLTSVPGIFPANINNITVTQSTFITLESLRYSRNIRHITFQNCEITTLGAHFLHASNSSLTVEFLKVQINTIASFAFNQIKNLASLSFNLAMIGIIEKEAFSDISKTAQILIKESNIGTIQSKAFTDISAKSLVLNNCDIEELKGSSFHSCGLNLIQFYDVTIRKMEKSAFKNITNTRRVQIDNCNLIAMECIGIMDLREATLENHGTFIFINSNLECSCNSGPLLYYIHNNYKEVSISVECVSKTSLLLNGPIMYVKDHFKNVCSNESALHCATRPVSVANASATLEEQVVITSASTIVSVSPGTAKVVPTSNALLNMSTSVNNLPQFLTLLISCLCILLSCNFTT